MSYSLHIASDVAQEKVNLEVPFNHQPGIDELRQVCESLFTQELLAKEGGRAGNFAVGRMQIYDDDATQWVDLVTTAQIHPFDQLYVFPVDLNNICQQRRELPPPRQVQLPRQGGGHQDSHRSGSAYSNSQQQVPAAPPAQQHRSASNLPRDTQQQPALVSQQRSSSQYSSAGVDAQFSRGPPSTTNVAPSVHSSHHTTSASIVNPHNNNNNYNTNSRATSNHAPSTAASPAANRDDKLRFAFDHIDASRRGFITSRDLGDVLNHFGILFSASVINEMFTAVLDNVDGISQFQRNNSASHWNLVDFTQWSRLYPVTFSVLHQRLYLQEKQGELSNMKNDKEDALAGMRQRRDDLARQLQEAEQQIEAELRAVQNIDADLQEMNNRRAQDDEEEQVIMDKEVSVQHQRALLRREEVDYEQLAERRGLLDRRGSDNSGAFNSSHNYGDRSTARSLYNTPRGGGGLNTSSRGY